MLFNDKPLTSRITLKQKFAIATQRHVFILNHALPTSSGFVTEPTTTMIRGVKRMKMIASQVPEGNDADNHNRGVGAVAFHPDGNCIASGGTDGSLVFSHNIDASEDISSSSRSHVKPQRQTRITKAHAGRIRCISFSPADGSLVATCGGGGSGEGEATLNVYRDEKRVQTVTMSSAMNAVVFSPRDESIVVTGGDDNSVQFMRWRDGTCLHRMNATNDGGGKGGVTSLRFNSEGSQLAAGYRDGTVVIWNVVDETRHPPTRALIIKEESEQAVVAVAFSPDGTQVVVASREYARVWDSRSGTCVMTLTTNKEPSSSTYPIHSVCFTGDGNTILCGNEDHVVFFSVTTNGATVTATISGGGQRSNCVALHRKSGLVSIGGADGNVAIWSTKEKCCTSLIDVHHRGLHAIAFSHDGRFLAASGVGQNGIMVKRIKDGETVLKLQEPHNSDDVKRVAFSGDDALIATSGAGNVATIWRAVNGEQVHVLPHSDAVNDVAFSPDDAVLATCCGSVIFLWRVRDGALIATLTGKHTDMVNSIAFNYNGTQLLSGGQDKLTVVWHIAERRCIIRNVGHPSAVVAVAFSPDGKLIASASAERLNVWNNDSFTFKWHHKLQDSHVMRFGGITGLAFGPDGTNLIATSDQGQLQFWKADSKAVDGGECTATLGGHFGSVASVAFNPDGTQFATAGGADGTVRLWHVQDGVRTGTICTSPKQRLKCIALSSDSSYLVALTTDNVVTIWRTHDGSYAGCARCNDSATPTALRFSITGALEKSLLRTLNIDGSEELLVIKVATEGVVSSSSATCLNPFTERPPHWPLPMIAGDDSALMVEDAKVRKAIYDEYRNAYNALHLSCVTERMKQSIAAAAHTDPYDSSSSPGLTVNYSVDSGDSRGDPGDVSSTKLSNKQKVRYPQFPRTLLSTLNMLDTPKNPLATGTSCLVRKVLWNGKPYAFKEYFLHIVKEVQRELSVAPYLRHNHIACVVAIVHQEDETPVGLLIELCNRSLGASLAPPQRPSTGTLIRWLSEVAQAIEFAHTYCVVHSDIKPENILLTDTDVAKLSDFGSSFVLSTTTQSCSTTTARGTPLYMAPEYAKEETGPTKEADVFSFGMTLWRVMSAPSTDHGLGVNVMKVAISIASGIRPPLDSIERDDVKTLITQCWASDPSKRPTMTNVVTVLSRIAASIDSSLSPPPPPATVTLNRVPSSSTLLKNYLMQPEDLVTSYDALKWNTSIDHDNNFCFSEPIVDTKHPCYRFVLEHVGPDFKLSKVARIVMVRSSQAQTFIALHEADGKSREVNSCLRVGNAPDEASKAALDRLKQAFVPVANQNGHSVRSRIVLAWHGTKYVEGVCRDGPRALRTTDGGYFGAGSYFALEAAYAARYSQPPNEPTPTECAIILFAVSVSQVKPITPELDYPIDGVSPMYEGFSKYYSFDPATSVALAPKFDAHFIPVKDWGYIHPRTGGSTSRDVGHQAVDLTTQHKYAVEGHELVIHSHHRAVPLAVLYFTP